MSDVVQGLRKRHERTTARLKDVGQGNCDTLLTDTISEIEGLRRSWQCRECGALYETRCDSCHEGEYPDFSDFKPVEPGDG